MGLVITLVYLILTLMTPQELVPDLLEYRIVLVVFLLALTASIFTAVGNHFSFQAPQIPLEIGLIVYGAITVIWADKWLGGAYSAMLDLLFLTGIVLVVSWNVVTPGRLRVIIFAISLVGMIITIQAIVAITTGYRLEEFSMLDKEPDKATGAIIYTYRICGLGLLHDPNDLAQFLLIDTALLGCCWKKGKMAANLFLVLLPASLLLTGVLLTHSRGAFLAVIVMVFFLLQKRLGKAAYLVGGALGVVMVGAMVALTGRELSMSEGSAAGRLDAWYEGMQMFKNSPLFGVGYARFTEHHYLTAHNSYMLCIAELGFPGFLLWLGPFVVSILQMRSLSSLPDTTPQAAELRQMGRCVLLALTMFGVTAWFLSRSYTTVLYILLGCTVGVAELAHKAGFPIYAVSGKHWKGVTFGAGVVVLLALQLFLRARGLG